MNDVIEEDRPLETAARTDQQAEIMTVERDVLLTCARHAAAVIETRNTIPILNNVKISVEGGQFTIAGTDMDIDFQITAGCAHGGNFSTTVHGTKLISALDTLRPGKLGITVKDGWMHLKQQGSSRKLPVLSPDQYPQIATGEVLSEFSMPAPDLVGLLDTVHGFASSDDKFYYLNGVHLHVADDRMASAATDKSCLAQALAALPGGANTMPDLIIGSKAVNILKRMLADPGKDEMVEVQVHDGKIMVRRRTSRVVAKLIEGSFPNYRRVIPTPGEKHLVVHSAEFERCVRAGAAMSDGKTRGVRIDLSSAGSTISATSSEGGQATEPIDGDYQGPPLMLGLNSVYALQTVKAFGGACNLHFHFGDERSHILVRSPERPGITIVLMPMRP